jgi:RAD51-like protein 2
MLERMHYLRVHSVEEQLAVINALPSLLASLPAVRVVVIDSISFHFRYDFGGDNAALRSRVLGSMAQRLAEAACTRDVAVMLINQVTTKVGTGPGPGGAGPGEDQVPQRAGTESRLVPALGEIWGHACQHRVLLYWKDGARAAHLFKSPSQPAGTALYAVTPDGVRDCVVGPRKRPAPTEEPNA